MSEGSSLTDNDGNQTIHTLQHGSQSPHRLGTSPVHSPLPGHTSTLTQPQTGTPETDRSPPLSQGVHNAPSLLLDELYGGSDASRRQASSIEFPPDIDPPADPSQLPPPSYDD